MSLHPQRSRNSRSRQSHSQFECFKSLTTKEAALLPSETATAESTTTFAATTGSKVQNRQKPGGRSQIATEDPYARLASRSPRTLYQRAARPRPRLSLPRGDQWAAQPAFGHRSSRWRRALHSALQRDLGFWGLTSPRRVGIGRFLDAKLIGSIAMAGRAGLGRRRRNRSR